MNIQINITKGTSEYPPQGNEGIENKQVSDTSDSSLDTTLDRIATDGNGASEGTLEKGMVDMFTSFVTSFKEMMKEYMSQIKQMVSGIVESFKSMQSPLVSTTPKTESSQKMHGTSRKMESFAERVPVRLSGHKVHGHVNETDLQAAIVSYQLYQKSEDAEHYFLSRLEDEKGKNKSPSEALKAALVATQEAGKISKNEADFVYSLSFRAAQIDDNLEEVSEAPHGAGTMDLGHAVKSAEINLAKVIQGKLIIDSRSLY